MPATAKLSLAETGMPSSAPRGQPARQRPSAARAASRAASQSKAQKALIWPSVASTTALTSERTSTGEAAPDRFVTTFRATWSPGWELLGGAYWVAANIPYADVSVNIDGGVATIPLPPPVGPIKVPIPGGNYSGSGFGDLGISPFNVSWALTDNFHITASFSFYAPIGSYTETSRNINAVNIGTGYWTLEPSLGFTYLSPEGRMSLNMVYDFALENNHSSTIQTAGGGTLSGNYQSGDMLIMDFSAVRFLERWSLGVGGYYAQQVTSDKIDGIIVPELSIPGLGQTRGQGNRYMKFALGPLVGYDFGALKVTAYYNYDFLAENAVQSSSYWLRASLKLP